MLVQCHLEMFMLTSSTGTNWMVRASNVSSITIIGLINKQFELL